MVTTSLPTARATVRSVPVDDPGDLIARLPGSAPLAWLRRGDGLVGWGEALRLDVGTGADRFGRAQRWWAQTCAQLQVIDEVGLPGSGPIAFGSFTFDPDVAGSVLIVPQVLLGRRAGHTWLTAFGGDAPTDPGPVDLPLAPQRLRYSDGSLSDFQWQAAVRRAVADIRDGRLEKVVLARDLLATSDIDVDARFLLQRLSGRYPECWSFSVDGLVGATPELLVRREAARVESGVLAGSVRRGRDAAEDAELGGWLLSSAKDLQEHSIAVRSVADVLARHCDCLEVPARPRLLTLANISHLATDISGRLVDEATGLALAGDLHPSAAVCGTPTDVAAHLIRSLEGMERGRYTGPVGWTDAGGDGEWGIALRCAELAGSSVRLFAGCGIVADSDPDAELAEAQVKLAAMRDALEGL